MQDAKAVRFLRCLSFRRGRRAGQYRRFLAPAVAAAGRRATIPASLRLPVWNRSARAQLLVRCVKITEQIEFLEDLLVRGNIEQDRRGMAALREDQGSAGFTDVFDEFSGVSAEF